MGRKGVRVQVPHTAGRLTATEFSSYRYDAAGRVSGVSQNLYQAGDADPMKSSMSAHTVAWTPVYSMPDRLRHFDAPGHTHALTYDNNGNRASGVVARGA